MPRTSPSPPKDSCPFFGEEQMSAEAGRTSLVLLLVIAAAVLVVVAWFFWVDRSRPIERGHVVAILEQPQGGRP